MVRCTVCVPWVAGRRFHSGRTAPSESRDREVRAQTEERSGSEGTAEVSTAAEAVAVWSRID